MRSQLVFGATTYVSNRYLLAQLAAKATRRLHRRNSRIEETTNDVLVRLGRANPEAAGLESPLLCSSDWRSPAADRK